MSITANALFCDDIRQEVNGKFILVGAYPSDIIPGSVPSVFSMSVLIRVYGIPIGDHKFHFRVLSPNGSVVMEQSDAFVQKNPTAPMILAFHGFPMSIEGRGVIRAMISVDGTEVEAGNLPVVFSEDVANWK